IENVLKEKLKTELFTNKNHNHAILEKGKYIHRKGATPAKNGEKGIIPGNMRDGSFLVKGLGNPKFLHSSSHGAGRLLSRSSAREKITMKDFEKSMKGIKGTISQKTLDEAPMAYKNIDKIMDIQKRSVKILKHLKPLINWKG
ncbi:MAG: RtcB family protein, partial [Nanoarchaeota archaeon]|nr:RtcB family protein [Nanoarchaeota archaeon]